MWNWYGFEILKVERTTAMLQSMPVSANVCDMTHLLKYLKLQARAGTVCCFASCRLDKLPTILIGYLRLYPPVVLLATADVKTSKQYVY